MRNERCLRDRQRAYATGVRNGLMQFLLRGYPQLYPQPVTTLQRRNPVSGTRTAPASAGDTGAANFRLTGPALYLSCCSKSENPY
jgi:hypothetical protein